MDIQTFSKTYWYIWLLAVLLILLLVLLNGLGGYLYHKKRRKFIAESNQMNNDIPMRTPSRTSTVNLKDSRSRQMSFVTNTHTKRPSRFSSIKVHPPAQTAGSSRKLLSTSTIASIRETKGSVQPRSSSRFSNEKCDMDLTLEEFQRQALIEHNRMRAIYKKAPLKLAESLNIYAQYWAEECALANVVRPSKPDWRLHCRGQPLGENIVSVKSSDTFNGSQFTLLLMANGNHSQEVDCVLNEISTEVGFGRSKSEPSAQTQQSQWIGVAHYYPYRQLTAVQS